jgi:hypothetical protein
MIEQLAMACYLLLSDIKVGDKLKVVVDILGHHNIIVTALAPDGFIYDLDPPIDLADGRLWPTKTAA